MSVMIDAGVSVRHAHGILTITDANTTIGYCRHDDDGNIEYIFVHPFCRRQGHAKRMLALVNERVRKPLRLVPPVSPLGEKLRPYCVAV